MMRTADIKRDTKETQIRLSLCLDGTGKADIRTGVGFLDHMLELFARHGDFDLTAKGLYGGLGGQAGHHPLRPVPAAYG